VAPFVAERVACPHSVVTAHLIDAAGQPTIEARDDILAFFTQRLVWEAGAPNSAGSRGEPR